MSAINRHARHLPRNQYEDNLQNTRNSFHEELGGLNFTVLVFDTQPPTINCPPNITISCAQDENDLMITGHATASDNCLGVMISHTDSFSGNTCSGTFTRTWKATDASGAIVTCVQTIKKEDKTPPTFICPTSNVNPIECTANPNLGVPTNVMDNCGGKIDQSHVDIFSANGCFTTVTRTWTVTDQCGNTATCNQEILMQDTKAPLIKICGRKITVQGIINPDGICYGNVTISTPTVTDGCSSNVSFINNFNNTSNASSGNYPIGQTIVKWTAKDDCGLMTMCEDTVVVLECANCCWDNLAFDSIASLDFKVIRDECSVHISHPGLSPCQRVTYMWSNGVSSGPLTGAADATYDYGISGDYTICALIEEVDDSGIVCFSAEKCFDVCFTCGEGCVDDRIVYECHDLPGITSTDSRYKFRRYELIHHNNKIYAANSILQPNGYTDAALIIQDENCQHLQTITFGGDLDDEINSIKYDPVNNHFILTGAFSSPTITIQTNSGNVTLINKGRRDGFAIVLDANSLIVKWAFSIGAGWDDSIEDVDVDNFGNIYISGAIRARVNLAPIGTSGIIGYGNITTGFASGFVAKYDANGLLLWYDLIEPNHNLSVGCRALFVDGQQLFLGGDLTADSLYVNPIGSLTLPHGDISVSPQPGSRAFANFILAYQNDQRIWSDEIHQNTNKVADIYDIDGDGTNIYVGGCRTIAKYDYNGVLYAKYFPDFFIYNLELRNNTLLIVGSNPLSNPNMDFINTSQPTLSQGDWQWIIGKYNASNLNYLDHITFKGYGRDHLMGLESTANGDIFVQGMTASHNMQYEPSNASLFLNTNHALNQSTIFIGKYSCACDQDTDCCEDLNVSFSGQDLCCKSLNLVNNAGFDICSVTVELTTPGWILNTSSTATGYIFNPIYNGLEISHTSGSLPSGTLNNLAEFCLSGSGTALPTTQQFIVKWYENTTSGNKLVSCTDTLIMSCNPPPPVEDCLQMNITDVICNPSNPNIYTVSFAVTNLSANITATSVYLSGLPSGFSFVPCNGGTYSNNISIPVFPFITPGQTSVPLCVQIYSSNPVLNFTDICFESNLKGLNGNFFACCEEGTEQCISLIPCCQPCGEMKVDIKPISLLSNVDRCCFRLSLDNQCSYQYFTKMDVNILTPNVHFGYISLDANWSNCTSPSLQNICLAPNSGVIGSGNINDVLQFCLSNVTSTSQVPQEINFKFYTTGSNGLDSLACDTLIYLECPFKPVPNDSCLIVTNSIAYCDIENGKYNVSMTIMNNSNPNFCAQEIVINLLEPGLADPSAIQLYDPLCYGESVTLNFMLSTSTFPDIDGLMPLIISMKNLDGTCCRGGLAYIDTLVLPECPCTTTCCDSGQNEDFENYTFGNLPNNQVGWVNQQGFPQVVVGGANGSGKSISLHAGSRGVRPASVSYGNSGVVGPDTIFQANKQYCITFWAKLLPVFNLNGRLSIYADGQLLQTIIIPSTNTSWTQYSFNFIAPPPGQEILIFTNESAAPTDAGPGILLDQICFEEVIQIFDDQTPPVLSCPLDLTIQDTDSDCIVQYMIPNISVTDPTGVAFVQCFLDGVLVPVGSTHNLNNTSVHTVKFIAEDICGNRDSCSYNVTVDCVKCICPSNIPPFTITHNSMRTDVKCGETIIIGCPVTDLFINGMISCQNNSPIGNCPPNTVSWTLDRPSLPDLSGNTTTGNVSVMLLASDVSEPGLYSITFTTMCPGSVDECECVISWIQEDCNTVDQCCKDRRKFLLNTQNAVLPGKDEKDCRLFVNIAKLDTCIRIDKIDWGNGVITNGPLQTGQTHFSPVLVSGNYTIIVTLSEYNANGVKCWSNDVGYSLVLNCSNTICSCRYGFFQIEKEKVDCNNPAVKLSCPNKTPVFISGDLGCTPTSCGTGLITYTIKNSSNVAVHSGTLSGSAFNLQLLAGWFDPLSGQYSIGLETTCGTNVCKCALNFIVPECRKDCLCDQNFNAEVSLGFSTQHFNIPVCRKRFTPKNLCEKDRVSWTLNGTLITNSMGNEPAIFNILPSNSTVCMIVERMESPNKICRDTICQFYKTCAFKNTPALLCPLPKNSTFDGGIAGSFIEGGMIPDWSLKSGRGVVFVDEGIDFENVMLIASKNNPSELFQNCCIEPSQPKKLQSIQFDIQNFGFERLKSDSKLKIFNPPNDVTITESDLIIEVDISDISFGWNTIFRNLEDAIWKHNNLVIRFESQDVDDAYIRLDNLCFDFVSNTNDINNFNNYSIYPNPTSDHLTIQFATATDQDINLKVMDVLGRLINNSTIQKGSSIHNFSIEDMAGIYIIQLTDSKGNMSQRKVIKIE